MTGQYREAIKQSFCSRVRSGHPDPNGLRIQFTDLDRLAINQQQIALCGLHLLIQVNLECEQDIIRIHRMSIREAKPTPKVDGVNTSVGGYFPSLGEGRLRP